MTISAAPFISRFADLKNYESVLDYSNDHLIVPYFAWIEKGVDRYPIRVRLAAPFIGVSVGLSCLVISVANLVEGIFKGFANLLIGAYSLDGSRIKTVLRAQMVAIGLVGTVTCYALISATIGSVGLIINPQWTCKKIFD